MKRVLFPCLLLLFGLASCTDDGPAGAGPGVSGPADPEPQPDPTAVTFWLTVLHSNSGESQLIDAGRGREDFGGIARFGTLADQLRQAGGAPPRLTQEGVAAGVILVSSGDNFFAGPEFALSLKTGIPFYDGIGLSLIGYDAMAIGNREFDFGPDVLADFIESFAFTTPPFLSSNLDFSSEPRLQGLLSAGRIAEKTVVVKSGESIGIIGATHTNLEFISSSRRVAVLSPVATEVQAEVDALEAMGVDKIILISHLQYFDQELALIPQLDGVDIVVAGGEGAELLANPDDTLIPGDVPDPRFPGYPFFATDIDGTRVPIVKTAGNYQYVGRLVVGFNALGEIVSIHNASGPVRVAGGANSDAVAPDLALQAQVVDPVKNGLAALATNIIAVSEVDLDGRRSQLRSRETNEGNLIADALLWQARLLADEFDKSEPDVALLNGRYIENAGMIFAGGISELETFNMLPSPNFVTIVSGVTRSQFKAVLEYAVSELPFGIRPFAQVAGFSFDYDPDGGDSARVVTATLDDGTPLVAGGVVVEGPALVVATIDAWDWDQYPLFESGYELLGVTYQQALLNYIVDTRTGLGGQIKATDYPEGGEGRITEL